MSQLVWLITGCSSGFGEQLVYSITARGDKVIATGRNLEKIKHLEKTGAATLQLDITDSQSNLNDKIAEATNIYGKIDVLVNNAAFVAIGTWEQLSSEDFADQFNTNVFGTIKVTRAILPQFRQQKSGTLVFVSSLSGWIGHPGCGAYAGSKFALEGIVESLHAETKPLGIRTLLLEPGRFRTNLLSPTNMKIFSSSSSSKDSSKGSSKDSSSKDSSNLNNDDDNALIADYRDFSQAQRQALANENNNQPGDPKKFVRVLIELVCREGVFKGMGEDKGRDVGLRLPLGNDAFEEISNKIEKMRGLLRDWEGVIRSTDF